MGDVKKIKVLALCDTPTSATGFAQVARNILTGLVNTGKYEIDVIGINYNGDYYDREKYPYNIYPAMPQGQGDIFGRDRLINVLNGNEQKLTPPWDLVFTIQDPFIVEGMGLRFAFGEQLRLLSEMWRRQLPPLLWFNWIGYFPVDADLKENWVQRGVALPQYTVAYCEWGKSKMLKWDREEFEMNFNIKLEQNSTETKRARFALPSLKDRIDVINHGVDIKDFYPLPVEDKKKFRKEFFQGKVKDDTFLIVNVSRNQPRKDITRTIAAFAAFKKIVPNSYLYIHAKANDAGGSIDEMARNFDLRPGDDYALPQNFNPNEGYSLDVVNNIYNAADLCVTTTLGEGWGFITTEAMAVKTPILAPNITSILDIFNSYDFAEGKETLDESVKLRGIPVKAGSTTSEWVCLGIEDNERIRPLTNVDDMVEKMLWVYRNPAKVNKIVDRAYEWVKTLSWENIVKQWDDVFMKAYKDLQTERELLLKFEKAGRNDECPCGSNQKFKKCHGATDRAQKIKDWIVS